MAVLAGVAVVISPAASATAGGPGSVQADTVSAQAGQVSAMGAACGRTAPDRDDSSWPRQTAGVSANMREGSSTTCDVAGWADNRDQLDYHCWTSGQNGTWTYLTNVTDGTTGWVKDSLLPRNGSSVDCEF
ncbi:SH3 domain-containing protein [Saccharothrix lopnurensis]|uniref:SH3 domain-containing protein n=1 Tax=Saccharothrix lopnurensis TaxID=1670621 RepID=A0ABW1P9G1_9PSEU